MLTLAAMKAAECIIDKLRASPGAIRDPGVSETIAAMIDEAFAEEREKLERLRLFAGHVRDYPAFELDKAMDWIGKRREEAERVLKLTAPTAPDCLTSG